ncbi:MULTISPECIES: hypothetical protein [Staphylococcus]|jgi:hypothetical protein|uniref:hypothetical protein n=1 Tax=Staphylococcus TaxID=1279 RepID=UPI000918C031|nr:MULTISPECIES: hypothetical protein [Staphylococcus]MBC3103871.1 hypothetical protein [Staphylococcus haemolyticus]MBC3144724.1 hypothetical protein [Staphylococcus haemolyticus]MDN8680124.1 hypothetical protein [Staphylococcus aureus]MDN8699177.1 hypothetical protein [Staphylococcus aureus]SGX34706.1 Uncharacterised protein [Staphylococcus argenteus]
MNQQHYYFEANKKDYRLSVTKDLFGCGGVAVIENGVYLGMIDCKDERDFKEIENQVRHDIESLLNEELYC